MATVSEIPIEVWPDTPSTDWEILFGGAEEVWGITERPGDGNIAVYIRDNLVTVGRMIENPLLGPFGAEPLVSVASVEVNPTWGHIPHLMAAEE